jgi:hypothetical protein
MSAQTTREAIVGRCACGATWTREDLARGKPCENGCAPAKIDDSAAFKSAHRAARQLGMSAHAYRTMGHPQPSLVTAQLRLEAQLIRSRLGVDGCDESEMALDRLMVLALALAGER